MVNVPPFLAAFATRALAFLDPEDAHDLTIRMLETGALPAAPAVAPTLKTTVAGMTFDNPLGLAAGFDKNARVPNQLLQLGFGFVEVGAVTPEPQAGNDKPRVFRLRHDQAVINRYGFNNDGLEVIADRLANRERTGCVGINLGANKTASDRTADYVAGLSRLAGLVDFYTVNISSPNTPGLRALQDKAALEDLLHRVLVERARVAATTPVFLKLSPDLTDNDQADIVTILMEMKKDGPSLDGLIISNTTLDRPDDLTGDHRGQTGGLSGVPLFEQSTRLLGDFYQALGTDYALIGVGGVTSARDAYVKILHGAQLVQLYTALIYQGPGLVRSILEELPDFLRADGFSSVTQAVGAQWR
ncbi:MAG: quinone-dependent dihydroorotate dehydrogenase [Pseudomonadota bacterium]